MNAVTQTLDWVRRVAIGLSVAWAVVIVIVFATRVGFPLELEWMEGGALQQALRLQRGEPIYGTPSADFVPFLYTPLYPMLLSVLGRIVPLGYVLGRAVSIASVVAICAALWHLVGQEGKPRVHQFVAVGLFLSGYVFTFRWLDVARGDALFMALTLWALTMLREAWGDWRRALLAGVLMGLAFWTKQTAFVFVLASGLAALLVAPRQLWIYAVTVGVIGLGGVALGQWLTDGQMWTYIYELHQTHRFNWARFTNKTWGMFIHAAPFLVLMLGVVLFDVFAPVLENRRKLDERPAQELQTRIKTRKGVGYWGILAAAGLLVSALGYSTQWAEPNAFIPGVTLGAAALAVALPKGGRLEIAGLSLACTQMVFALAVEPAYQPIQDRGLAAVGESYRWQSPARTIPTPAQREGARELRAMLEAQPGPVFALHRPWWSVLAGHRGHAGHVGSMGLNDVVDEDKQRILEELRSRIAARRYAQVWIEGEPPAWLRTSLAREYRVEQRRWGDARVRPITGYMSEPGMVTPYRQPQLMFVPITAREVPSGATVVADFEDGTLGGFTVEGRAFGRRAVGSFFGRQPPIGPIGGAFALSSAANSAGIEATGRATSPAFAVRPGDTVRLSLGKAGNKKDLTVALVGSGDARVEVAVPVSNWSLVTVEIPIPTDWKGGEARLVLDDASPKGALFMDDLWVTR